MGDWKFFEKLGDTIKKQPYNAKKGLPKAIMLVTKFWDESFSKMPYKKIVEFLMMHGVPVDSDHDNFRKTLNRVGLKKSRYNKK